jgi:formate dehydrogenase assembly factor FdhD
MLRIAVVSLGLIVVGLPPFELNGAQAQDIAGMEDCTKTAGLDKRTGCFQSNVNFLHQLVTKNALDARQRLNAANNEIVALKAALASLQTTVEQLQAAHKSANEKKPQAK